MTFQQGIYDISNELYHTSEGLSRSGVMHFKKSPLHYWNKYHNPDRKTVDTSDQKSLGSIVHSLILEPELFARNYVVEEKVDKRTKAGKARWEELRIENAGKLAIDEGIYEVAQRIRDAFMMNEYAPEFLKGADIEKSIFWNDSETGVLCKARPDLWKNNVFCDLKTATDASPRSFQRSIAQYGYHIQAAMVRDGIHHVRGDVITDCVFIAIESVEPYAVAVYILDKKAIDIGHLEYKQILSEYKKYTENPPKVWSSYAPSSITLPDYY